MAKPILTNITPDHGKEYKITTDPVRVRFNVPEGVGNPADITLEINDHLLVPHYVVTDPNPDLATPVIKIKHYVLRRIATNVYPQAGPYTFPLPPFPVIGFHVIQIVAWDTANSGDPGSHTQVSRNVRVLYP